MSIEKEIERLARREINTLRIGRVELQNNHGTLYCFYNARLVIQWENKENENGMKSIKNLAGCSVYGSRREKTRITNIFLKLVKQAKKYS